MISLEEQHLVTLPSQSSIYGLTLFGGSKTALIASLRHLVSVEFYLDQPDSGAAIEQIDGLVCHAKVTPVSKEVHFTYIPGGAEIISIDNFNKSSTSDNKNFVVGITFSKPGDSLSLQYFNVYTDWEETQTLNLESIAQSCISLKLDFIPYHLYHTEIWKLEAGAPEIAWLLSGSDGVIHLYREDTNQHTYCDHGLQDYFPEFVDVRRIVLWMDIAYYENHTRRLGVVGCEDGYVKAVTTRLDSSSGIIEIVSSWEIKHDSPIARVTIFSLNATCGQKRPEFLDRLNYVPGDEEIDLHYDDGMDSQLARMQDIHVLVTSSLEVSVVYWSLIAVNGFVDQMPLSCSDHFDCVACGCVADVDMDGDNEILLGTYGQELLVFKYSDAGEFELIRQRSFAYPLLSIDYVDMTGDGLKELIVLSTKGLHILQHSLEDVSDLVIKRLEELILPGSLKIDDEDQDTRPEEQLQQHDDRALIVQDKDNHANADLNVVSNNNDDDADDNDNADCVDDVEDTAVLDY